jgi:hypothetical protein
MTRYEILTARHGGSLRGYAVFAQVDGDAILADLISSDSESPGLLIGELASLLRRRGAVTLSAPLTASHPLVPALRRSGFRPREEGPVIVHGGVAPSAPPSIRAGDLQFSHGDRES